MRIYTKLLMILALTIAILAANCALAEQDDLTILFTADIHSNMTPHLTLINGQSARAGGFARLASAVKANDADGNALLLDAGDFSMGTLYQAFTESDALELTLMEKIGYDAIALGNHDFELTVEGLKKELAQFRAHGSSAEILCGNLVSSQGEKAAPETNPLSDGKNYAVIERNGLRIGIFALMGKQAIQYTPAEPLAFDDPIESAKRIVKVLREEERVDLVVLLSHAGITPDGTFTEDADIAKAVDGIDVIVSGHMHVPLDEPVSVNDTTIVCAGTGLSHLGKLAIRRENGKWTVASHKLLPLTDAWPEDAGIADMIAPYTARIENDYMARYGVTRNLNAVIAASPYDFSNDEVYAALAPHAFGALMADAYIYTLNEIGIDDVWVSCIPAGTVRAGLYKGDITLEDVYNVLSYGISPLDASAGAPIVTACITGRELYDLCETSASLSEMMDSVQMLLSGIRFNYSTQRPILDRVYRIEARNPATNTWEEVKRNDEKLYKLAFSWTSAQSLRLIGNNSYGLLDIRLKDESGSPLDTDEKLLNRIVHMPLDDGTACELKEWYALYSYISGFPENAGGLPEIPEQYGRAAEYMVKTDASFMTFFRNPSKTAWIMLAASIILLTLLAIGITVTARRLRKKHRHTH